MDFKYLLIFFISLLISILLIFLLLKLYFEKKNNTNELVNSQKDEMNQISELKGAVAQLSSTIEERLGNFGSSIGNSISQQTQNTQKSLMAMLVFYPDGEELLQSKGQLKPETKKLVLVLWLWKRVWIQDQLFYLRQLKLT